MRKITPQLPAKTRTSILKIIKRILKEKLLNGFESVSCNEENQTKSQAKSSRRWGRTPSSITTCSCHLLLPLALAMCSCHVLLPFALAMCSYHVLLPCAIAMRSCHLLLPCALAMCYCHLLLPFAIASHLRLPCALTIC